MHRLARTLVLTLVTLLTVPPVAAQDRWEAQHIAAFSRADWTNPITAVLDPALALAIHQQLVRGWLVAKYGNVRGEGSNSAAGLEGGRPPERPALHAIEGTDFEPTGYRPMLDAYASAGLGAAQQQQIAKLLGTLIASIEQSSDFRKNNLTYGLALTLIASIQVATGNLVPVGDVEQVVRDLNDVLVTHAGYLRMSAQERQDAYDAALLTGGVVVMLYTTGQMRNEDALAAQARSMARQILIDVFRWRGN